MHKSLFTGVFKFAGQIRQVNITKKEWVLQGDTVFYSSYDLIKQTLDYDFEKEKSFDYKNLSIDETIKHITRFTANLWQIHPFREGNTRTTAVFTIKYLRKLGFDVTNDIFAKHSCFFRNLLLNEKNELKNRYVVINAEELLKNIEYSSDKVAIKQKSSDIIIEYLKNNATINSTVAQQITGLSPAGVRKIFAKLTEEKILTPHGANKNRTYSLSNF